MTSWSSSLASSTPATSLKVIFLLLAGQQPGPTLAEAERLIPSSLHLTHHEDPKTKQQDER